MPAGWLASFFRVTGYLPFTANLGVGLVRAGKKVLVIDADPQGNLSQSLGIMNPDE